MLKTRRGITGRRRGRGRRKGGKYGVGLSEIGRKDLPPAGNAEEAPMNDSEVVVPPPIVEGTAEVNPAKETEGTQTEEMEGEKEEKSEEESDEEEEGEDEEEVDLEKPS